MRISKRVVGLVVLILIINTVLSFVFHSPSYLRVALHEIQSDDVNYDIVFVGQSHGANAYNPYIIEEKTGMPAYNLCRGLMCNRDTAYLVKESNYKNDVKYIIYDIDTSYWTSFENPNYVSDGYVFPHLNNPINKIEYFFRYTVNESFRYTLCRYVLYGSGGLKALPDNIKAKLKKEYYEYDLNAFFAEREQREYQGRGFFAGSVKDEGDYKPTKWNEEDVVVGALNGFKDIVEYCKEENIQLICISSPTPLKRLQAEGHDEINKYFSKLAKQSEIEFWDFNYIKPEYLVWDDDDFQDSDGHMFGTFANEYSEVLGDILNQYFENESVTHYFDTVCMDDRMIE